jgi:hypothetical protein
VGRWALVSGGDECIAVVAWRTTEVEVVRARRTDLGERPITRAVEVGHAAVWLNRATPADVEKARVFAAQEEGRRVFCYPTSERDPLGRARKEVLRA